jgi:hypothetical protein
LKKNNSEIILSQENKMNQSINFNADQDLQYEEYEPEYEPDFSQIKSPRANLINSPRQINILPITNTLVDIEEKEYNTDLVPVSKTISTVGKSRSTPLGGTPVSLTETLSVNSSLIPEKVATTETLPPIIEEVANIPSTIYNLLSDESKELLAVNKLNQKIVQEADFEEIKEEVLPIISANTEAEDDQVIPVFENVVKIRTINKSSGFFHALLKAIYPKYNQVSGIKYRMQLVKKFRAQLSKILDYNDEKNSGYTYYQTLSQITKKFYPDLEQISLTEYKTLLNSDQDLAEDIFEFTAYVLGIGLYLVLAYPDTLRLVSKYPGNQNVVIYGLESSFEPVGVVDSGLIQTVFSGNDPFLESI